MSSERRKKRNLLYMSKRKEGAEEVRVSVKLKTQKSKQTTSIQTIFVIDSIY